MNGAKMMAKADFMGPGTSKRVHFCRDLKFKIF